MVGPIALCQDKMKLFQKSSEIKSVLFTERTCYEWHGDDLPELRRIVFAKWCHQRGRHLCPLFVEGMDTLLEF